jgi:hypothetical protein
LDLFLTDTDDPRRRRQTSLAIINGLTHTRDLLKARGLTLILIADSESLYADDYIPEGYLADIVVNLTCDTLEKKFTGLQEGFDSNKERLLFCEVTKARGLKNQRRRCCYDFQPPYGIRFYDTYAAEGTVRLFSENVPQEEEINTFKDVDVPSLYPMVQVDSFDRHGMLRTFSAIRRGAASPIRKPALLYNLDEYWLQTLVELSGKLKRDILHPLDLSRLHICSDGTRSAELLPELMDKPFLANKSDRKTITAVPHRVNISMLAYRSDLIDTDRGNSLETWDEILEICLRLRQQKLPYHYLIEFRNFDSFLATMLEFIWSFGANLKVENRTPTWSPEDIRLAVEAMKMVQSWRFDHKIIPAYSTLDLSEYHSKWAFARHWYSTLVQLVIDKPTDGVQKLRKLDGFSHKDIKVSRIPISTAYHDQQAANDPNGDIKHHSTWGEWYLAVSSDTENTVLAEEIINNLMSQRRVIERAVYGAGLPPVLSFYKDNTGSKIGGSTPADSSGADDYRFGAYGNSICFPTGLTFSQVRNLFFRNACSRTMLEDFTNIAPILRGTFQAIFTTQMSDVEVEVLIFRTFREIEQYYEATR